LKKPRKRITEAGKGVIDAEGFILAKEIHFQKYIKVIFLILSNSVGA